ncbi:hypothetical protein [Paenibacillus vietnamensis]|uniref:hypothetical protein n=1 Tax=Paenibacillus vietnamensis TaxID=2590547 RepID=UPI001CD0E375|nr:hypothetical protein [Paenibacillus vietnamensis]
MEKSRTPLHKWLLTMFIVATCKEGINAVRLSTLIKVTYKTAWSILNKIRLSISEHDRTQLLCGVIDAKLEVFMSQPHPYPEALMKERSSIIARARNINDESVYVKLKLIQCEQNPRKLLNEQAEFEFMENHVSSLSNTITINRNYRRPRGAFDQLHSLARTVFQWINDTFHGIRYERAQSYLDEYCFRLNHQSRGVEYAFNSLLKLGVSGFLSINTRPLCNN